MTRYTPHEDAVLKAYIWRRVSNWSTVLALLPGRSRHSAKRRLLRLRAKAGALWRIPAASKLPKPAQPRRRPQRRKLTEEQVEQIRKAQGAYVHIAARFGICETYARRLILGLR